MPNEVGSFGRMYYCWVSACAYLMLVVSWHEIQKLYIDGVSARLRNEFEVKHEALAADRAVVSTTLQRVRQKQIDEERQKIEGFDANLLTKCLDKMEKTVRCMPEGGKETSHTPPPGISEW